LNSIVHMLFLTIFIHWNRQNHHGRMNIFRKILNSIVLVNIFLFHKKKKGSSNSSPWKESCMKREAKIPSKSIKIIEGILLKSMLGPSLSFQIWRSSWTWHVNLLTWKHQKMIMFMFISIMIESSLIVTRNWSCSVKFDLLGPAWEYKIICMCFFEKFHSSSFTFKLFKNLHGGLSLFYFIFLYF